MKKHEVENLPPLPVDTSVYQATSDEVVQRRITVFMAIVAVVAVLIMVRLWTMQVIFAPNYQAEAEGNRLRDVSHTAARGIVFDRRGRILVDNRPSTIVLVAQGAKPDKADIIKWSGLLKRSQEEIEDAIKYSKSQNPFGRPVIAYDVNLKTVARLRENQDLYPELKVSVEAVRTYPRGRLAAHVLGYVGEISDGQLKLPKYSRYEPGDIVGKSGVELSYEALLSGVKGREQLEVDAAGEPIRRVRFIPPMPGHSVRLSLDADVQAATEAALEEAARLARREGMRKAKEGAAVVLDVRTGEIIAMASYPAYDPGLFIGGISLKEWKRLNARKSGYPMLNRAVMSSYAPGSTFKPFVALAALSSQIVSPNAGFVCKGKWRGRANWVRYFRDWTPAGHGDVGLRRGIAESCDVVFYDLGYRFYKRGGIPMQGAVKKFGYGKPTGVDLPFGAKGRIPDPKWKKEFNRRHPEFARWLPGDTINMAIGQGDMLVSPLQLAVGYAAIANGGTVYRPHIVNEVLGADGRVVRKIEPEVISRVRSVKRYGVVRDGLAQVVSDGTAKEAFAGFPVRVAGKTGTAQVAGKDDFAWFASYGPVDHPRYAIVVLVEQGGHGGSIAAPAVRKIYSTLFNVEDASKKRLVAASDDSR